MQTIKSHTLTQTSLSQYCLTGHTRCSVSQGDHSVDCRLQSGRRWGVWV